MSELRLEPVLSRTHQDTGRRPLASPGLLRKSGLAIAPRIDALITLLRARNIPWTVLLAVSVLAFLVGALALFVMLRPGIEDIEVPAWSATAAATIQEIKP